jgi:hypothetical protein
MGGFTYFPIFIVNYNQLAGLRKLLNWLIDAGYRQIHVLDNCSTYRPLLRFYEELDQIYKGAIAVTTLEKNYGCRGLLIENVLDRFRLTGPYLYSDGDVVPDECCPPNVVEHLVSLLDANPEICKAGLGLRVDDLPKAYKFREQAILWESQHWRRPVSRGLFKAPIDTTFAVYRPGTPFALEPALRTGWPYLARHEPWYADSDQPSDEERFYDRCPKVHDTHWAGSRMPEWLQKRCQDLNSDKKTLINLGCGRSIMGGWINIDVRDDVGADLVFDLNACSENIRLPFAAETIDGFYMCDVLGHISRPLALMQELGRVAKPGAKLIIRDDRYAGGTDTYRDLVRPMTHFGRLTHSGSDGGYSSEWRVNQVKLIVSSQTSPDRADLLNRPLDDFALDVIVEFQVIGQKRQHQSSPVEWPIVTFASTPIVDEINF